MYGPDDPLFPATEIGLDKDRHFAPIGLKRAHWKTANAIRDIFRRRFEAAGLPYFHPHSFRKTLARLGTAMTTTTEEWAAWSQNLGHEDVTDYLPELCEGAQPSAGGDLQEPRAQRPTSESADSDGPDPETIARVLAHLQKKAS